MLVEKSLHMETFWSVSSNKRGERETGGKTCRKEHLEVRLRRGPFNPEFPLKRDCKRVEKGRPKKEGWEVGEVGGDEGYDVG